MGEFLVRKYCSIRSYDHIGTPVRVLIIIISNGERQRCSNVKSNNQQKIVE